MVIGLVGCGKQKREFPARAGDMYTSPLFKAAFRSGRRNCDVVYILSAKWGLLSPNQIIRPYNVSLGDLTANRREEWGRSVVDKLNPFPGDVLVFFAGDLYRKYIVPLLPSAVSVVVAGEHVGLYGKIKAYKEFRYVRSS